MTKGDQVLVSLAMLPGRKFPGVVLGKTAKGYRVRYESFGAHFTETFFPSRVELIA